VAKKTFREISKATAEQRIAARQYARAEIAGMKLKALRHSRQT
jgi:hypothetical protein